MPTPWSRTATSTSVSVTWPVTVTAPPSEYFTAFSTRLVSTCSILSGSA
jgi:hypothetical protein